MAVSFLRRFSWPRGKIVELNTGIIALNLNKVNLPCEAGPLHYVRSLKNNTIKYFCYIKCTEFYTLYFDHIYSPTNYFQTGPIPCSPDFVSFFFKPLSSVCIAYILLSLFIYWSLVDLLGENTLKTGPSFPN